MTLVDQDQTNRIPLQEASKTKHKRKKKEWKETDGWWNTKTERPRHEDMRRSWLVQTVMLINDEEFMCCTFLGEKTPRVPPSSRMATPISASSASLRGGKKNIMDITISTFLWPFQLATNTFGKCIFNTSMCMLVLRSVLCDSYLSLVQTRTSWVCGHIADTPHGHDGYWAQGQ